MILSKEWQDFEVIDAGFGEKIERWGQYTLRRPDPQVIWPWQKSKKIRDDVDAIYHRSPKGGGEWEYKKKIPQKWNIEYKNLKFLIEPTGFKHTGLFPEQAANWDWMDFMIRSSNNRVNVLNLFAYTGGATIACSAAGAEVCHVDASKGMVNWAKDNQRLSDLADMPIRYIVDDCIKFVQREVRRGKKYDALIMDPPSYGRGPKGELWKLEDELFNLIEASSQILSDDPLFVLVNSYTTGFSPSVAANILDILLSKKHGGRIEAGEIGLPIKNTEIVLPCGSYSRWFKG